MCMCVLQQIAYLIVVPESLLRNNGRLKNIAQPRSNKLCGEYNHYGSRGSSNEKVPDICINLWESGWVDRDKSWSVVEIIGLLNRLMHMHLIGMNYTGITSFH